VALPGGQPITLTSAARAQTAPASAPSATAAVTTDGLTGALASASVPARPMVAAENAAASTPVVAGADASGGATEGIPSLTSVAESMPKSTVADPTVPGVAAPTSVAQPGAAALVNAAPAVVAAAQVPLATQVATPLRVLAGAPDGEHTLTITVTPDNLGPVTVRAHVAGEHVRIELFAPNAEGRDALKQILTDLRRDLASQGLGAQLDLSGKNQPDSGDRSASERALPQESAARGRSSQAEPQVHRSVGGQTSMLDVLA
jgi:flagellar hook-length control protein FliK